jgi:carbon monoxide dehydrogenase subunit G
MSTFEHTIEIHAPVETVFAFDTDPQNWTRTMSSLRDLEIVEETETGARMHAVYKILGIAQDVEMEMKIVEPNEHLHISVEGSGMGSEIDIHYSETDNGTQIAHGATYEFGDSLLESVLEPVATRYTNRQFEMHLANTKDLVEAEPEAEAQAEARPAA